MQQISYEMIQLYHSKRCSMSKYRQKASIQSHPSNATITRPLFACSIQHFCKYREFVGIYIYIYIYRWAYYGSDRICGTSCCTALLTRQSKTKYVGICDPVIQSKNFLHANQTHSPFSWMFVLRSNHPLAMLSHLNMKKTICFQTLPSSHTMNTIHNFVA